MLKDGRESANIEDRRGMSGGRIALGGGCLTIIAALIIGLMGGNWRSYLQQSQQDSVQVDQSQPIQTNPQEEAQRKFTSQVLATTEDAWRETFRRSGVRYQEPKMVLYRGQTPTACGTGSAAAGPFYCPGDQKLYLRFCFF